MCDIHRSQQTLTLGEAVTYAQLHLDPCVDAALLCRLESSGLLPGFGSNDKRYLVGDIEAVGPIAVALARGDVTSYSENGFFDAGWPAQVHLGNDTWLPLGDALAAQDEPALRPALRNLAHIAASEDVSEKEGAKLQSLRWLGETVLRTSSGIVANAAENQVRRVSHVAEAGAADFARTAYYMGTKRDLGTFLVESLAGVLPSDGVVLDLMCGSGAASGAFSRVWPTYVSDAQLFCQQLAVVQGGGFDFERAHACLGRVLETAQAHDRRLSAPLVTLMRREAELSHSDLTPALVDDFAAHVTSLPPFSPGRLHGSWSPSAQLDARRQDARQDPFCLFTTYFAGLFFGLRQAVEIDSLRFAIEQLEDENEKGWALGALIVATSVQSSTYAAHFAQPQPCLSHICVSAADSGRRGRSKAGELTLPRVGRVLERWSGSIYREFAIRLESLARQSETVEHPIRTVPGPWETAIQEFARRVPRGPVAVYLDAPYTRDEYSRYYHVLETLVRYDYPSAIGYGRVPSKKNGERFGSEFFTKTQRTMEDGLVRIIQSVLAKGWTCAWSYSSTGRASIRSVIERVGDVTSCHIESSVAKHRHMSHRGRPAKVVAEHLVLFVPHLNPGLGTHLHCERG